MGDNAPAGSRTAPTMALQAIFSATGQACCAAIALFVIATTVFGKYPAEAQYATVLTLGLVAVFTLKPGPLARDGRVTLPDAVLSLILTLGALGTGLYYLQNYYDIAAFREGIPNQWDLICYAVGTVVVTEAARRVEGWVLVGIVVTAFLYMAFGHLMPGILQHRAMPISNALEVAYSYQGIFGIALGAVVDVVLAFVILGAAIRVSGAGDFFNFIALRATRGMRSGPAQSAILASTLFGSVNGSAPANVSSTGVLTIPMMVRSGFSARFAGGVEATASCVGQIMPPIMGVGAFIMSEVTGIPYATIMLVAIVPAFLFIFSLSTAAVLEAQRLGMRADAAGAAETWTALRGSQSIVLVAGFSTLLIMLFAGYSPTFCGLSAAGVVLAVAMVLPATRFGFKTARNFLVDGGRDGLSVLIACAAIGVIIGAITSTGLGIKLNQAIVSMGDSHLLLALLLAAVCSIILGMGLPTAASYLMVVFVAGPSLIELGVSQLQTHFFVFYYAVLSAITPPVALAVFAAAAIARDNPVAIAGNALRLCAVGFALPIIWIYHPQIFLDAVTLASLPFTALTLVSLLIVIVAFNAAHIGHFFTPLSPLRRVALALASIAAIYPQPIVQVAATAIVSVLLGARMLAHRRLSHAEA
ncbi:MAG: TRAP transporter fused permease subunit [Pseudomonadota bacterium]